MVKFLLERNGECRADPKVAKVSAFIVRWKLIDGPLKGDKVTYFNFQDPPFLSKLDHFLLCYECEDLFLGLT